MAEKWVYAFDEGDEAVLLRAGDDRAALELVFADFDIDVGEQALADDGHGRRRRRT